MITGTGDHLRPEWPITITGMRTQGFVCPGCGTSKAWELQTKSWT
jgi:hypothetical protein